MADDFRTALAEFEERLDNKLDARFASALRLDERFGQVDQRFAEARAHTDARFDELKTKLDIVYVELKTKLDIVYDGVVGVNERVGALELSSTHRGACRAKV